MNAIVEILTHFIQANGSYGLLVIFAIIFTGCAIAFFLPGDSLLFACGILIAQHVLGFWPVVIVGIIAAI